MRQWFTMKAADKSAEIVIYDEIGKSWWGEDTVSAKSFLDELNALGDVDAITLRINSPGGDVFDGVAIHNAIKNHKATVTAHIDGLAASAASFIAMAAAKIVMPANSFMLVHGASGFSFGNADDMRAVADDLDRIDKSLTATYAARSKSSTAKVKALMKEDRLMDAAEAKEWGFADEVTKEVKMAARYSLRLLPQAAAERVRAQTGDDQGDPPPPDAKPEGPVVEPVPQPAPPAPPVADPAPRSSSAEVIDLNAARRQGIEEHQAYVASVTDLCTLARAPERVGAYVRANTSVEQVRKELLTAAVEEPVLNSHHGVPVQKQTAASWDKITAKLNARTNK
ncbi:MAG TPA: head maturation protease, ClpP-related [Casimicrobiaceae bacterium]|jgi:ATP-dependent protease ClpP protease subunit|nr:head maturation protease, ClpP-related [Casimicrobiaceae bacterium]